MFLKWLENWKSFETDYLCMIADCRLPMSDEIDLFIEVLRHIIF